MGGPTIVRDAGNRLDEAARKIIKRDSVDYRTALYRAERELPSTAQAYSLGVIGASTKEYNPETEYK